MHPDLLYQLALVRLKGIGPVNTRKLVEKCGGVEAVFRESERALEKIPGIPSTVSDDAARERALKEAEDERLFVDQNSIDTHFYLEATYSDRLKLCSDAPIVLFSKGRMDMNARKCIGIVGTRRATHYGKDCVERLIEGLAPYDPLIVSGLAAGIDVCAHRASVKRGLQTIACMGSGIDRIYPSYHKKTALEMETHGGIVTEFWSGTKPDRENFPQRNRIVAGMIDVLVVVESTRSGGSMITAKLAHGYNREIMAVPGRMTDDLSEGCNALIQREQAGIVTEAEDIIRYMGWDLQQASSERPSTQLTLDLNQDQTKLVALLRSGPTVIDNLAKDSGISVSRSSVLLLELEFAGVVKSLPGNVYALR